MAIIHMAIIHKEANFYERVSNILFKGITCRE